MAAAAATVDKSGMMNLLVDPLEPAFNGGLLNPLLAWASAALPDQLSTTDSPADVLRRVMSANANQPSSDNLGSVFKTWMSGRLQSHMAYFVLSGILLVAWLLTCCCLLGVTVRRERHRRTRLRKSAPDGHAGDQADAAVDGGGVPFRRSQYRLFGAMLLRRMRRLTRGLHQDHLNNEAARVTNKDANLSGMQGGHNHNNNSIYSRSNEVDTTDHADPWSTLAKTSAPTQSMEELRPTKLSTKTLSGRDRCLLVHICMTGAASLMCIVVLIAYCTQAGGIVALTSSSSGSSSARTIVSSTVSHLDRFLTRSLVESNRTIIDTFERAYPSVERLFLNFGTELLDLLMSDYGIDKLIGHLEFFLATVNGTVNSMRYIADARDTVIKPLQQFSAQLQVHRDTLQDPLSTVCKRFGHLFAPGHCASLVTSLADLRLAVNDTKLDTDSSVAIVTLLNKMVKLDIDNVQRQVEKAKDSLSTGLQAISGVIRQLLNGLIDSVSSQFDQAEVTLVGVKSGFDGAATDPNLWGAVTAVGTAVVVLVVVSCLVFLLTCAICCLLLWALARYLRTACRLDASLKVNTDPTPCHNLVQLSTNSSPLRRSSASSTISSGGFYSSPWSSPRFSDRKVERDASIGRSRPPGRSQKMLRLQKREWNGFLYCCSFDCSLVLLTAAMLSVLPLLFGLAFFYATGELQVEACRYLGSQSGNKLWDLRLDEFTEVKLWPLVHEALKVRQELPISLPARLPSHLIETIRGSCSNPNATLFSVFGLTGLLNATALLSSNMTQSQFLTGAKLVKDQINATDANALIPPELGSLTSVLPQLAGLLDAENYADSITELRRPLLVMPRSDRFIADVANVGTVALNSEPSNSDAAILRHSVAQLNASMSRSTGLTDRLAELRRNFELLQNSRNFTSLTGSLLAALRVVQATLADKPGMLARVDARFNSCLARHLPLFAEFLDPLAVGLLASVGHCDDLRLAVETLSVDLCSKAVPQANAAAFLLLLTTCFFAVLFGLSWWLLVLVGRHQAAVLQFEFEASRNRTRVEEQSGVCDDVTGTDSSSSTTKPPPPPRSVPSPVTPPVPPRPSRRRQRLRFGESEV